MGNQTPVPSVRNSNLLYYGYNNNLRAEYLSNYMANDYIDTDKSYPKVEVRLDKSVQNDTFPAKFNENTVYNTLIPPIIPYFFAH